MKWATFPDKVTPLLWLINNFVHLSDSLAYQVPISNTDRFYIDDGYKLLNCEVLIDILCSDCGLLGVIFYPIIWGYVFKGGIFQQDRIHIRRAG